MKTWFLVVMSAAFFAVFGAVTAALLASPEGRMIAATGMALLVAPQLIVSLQRRGEPPVT